MVAASLEKLLEDAKRSVQGAPTDFAARSALWQLFAADGARDRARKQLDMLVQLDSSWALEVQACHGLLAAEDQREKVLSGHGDPDCLGPAPAWLSQARDLLGMVARGDQGPAAMRLTELRDVSPACSGTLNGQPFEWICDGDARIGPVLELMINGRYLWAPWPLVRSVVTRPPNEVRDMLWQHALVELIGENPVECFLPARYPRPRNGAEALSRVTDWDDLGGDFYIGYGQKCLMTDVASVAVLEMRSLNFNADATA